MGLALFMAVWIGIGINRGDWMGGAWAAGYVAGQAAIVIWLHQILSRQRHPLHGTRSFWYLGVAVVLGSLPINLLIAVGIWVLRPEPATGFSLEIWWIAAVTSMAAITPIVLAVIQPIEFQDRRAEARVTSLLVFIGMYASVLGNVFLEFGS